jgi:protein TonB
VTTARHPLWPSLAVAAALHAAGLGWIAARPPAKLKARRPPTTVRLVARERPPPAEKAEEPKRPVPTAAPRPPPAAAIARVAPPAAAPAAEPAPTARPQPRRFAVSMSATSPGGGVAVPTTAGPTAARGNPLLPAAAPVGDNTAFAGAAADVTEVERGPQLLRQPSALELRGLYPEQARRDGVEGDVRLELLVTADGTVTEVRVLEPAGHGFDEVAAKAARQILFRPAERGGRAVAVRIPWTLKFRLDG